MVYYGGHHFKICVWNYLFLGKLVDYAVNVRLITRLKADADVLRLREQKS